MGFGGWSEEVVLRLRLIDLRIKTSITIGMFPFFVSEKW